MYKLLVIIFLFFGINSQAGKSPFVAYNIYKFGKSLMTGTPLQFIQGQRIIADAFNKGFHPAGFELGIWNLKNKDEDQALKYIRKAAEFGNPYSQYLLGIFYESGLLLEKDSDLAEFWYKQAANEGIDWEAYIKYEEQILNSSHLPLQKE